MVEPHLASQNAPDTVTLWRALRLLVDRVGNALEGDVAIDGCLDIVVELLGADRGLIVLEQEGGATAVVHARGPRKQLSPSEQEEMSRTIVRRALETDAAVVWQPSDVEVESASIAALGIHSALVAPLRGRAVPRGVIYVDFRHPAKYVEPAHQEFFMAAVVLIAGMFEQNAGTRRATDRLREAASHCTESRHGPSLEEMLSPRGMAALRDDAVLAARGTSPVLILGESGSGKTLLAQAIAEASGRKPVVRVVLGASDDLNTITSELFGHERGAFSGATAKRIGLAEYADGGILVLDEVLNLPLHAQRLLLDFVQFGTYRPLGYDKPQPKRADVRIIAATNGDLPAAVRQHRFREDLYYRLVGVTLEMPPLRRRREDIAALAESMLRRHPGSSRIELSIDARKRLAATSYDWPGNMRELEWLVRRACDRAMLNDPDRTELRPEDFPELARKSSPDSLPPQTAASADDAALEWNRLQDLKIQVEQREIDLLRLALERNDGVIARAAKDLGIARTTFAYRAQALGLVARR